MHEVSACLHLVLLLVGHCREHTYTLHNIQRQNVREEGARASIQHVREEGD